MESSKQPNTSGLIPCAVRDQLMEWLDEAMQEWRDNFPPTLGSVFKAAEALERSETVWKVLTWHRLEHECFPGDFECRAVN